jgi:hypothetical protein
MAWWFDSTEPSLLVVADWSISAPTIRFSMILRIVQDWPVRTTLGARILYCN